MPARCPEALWFPDDPGSSLTQATETRELIIESAYACFRKHGLQKATIVDIAKMASVSRSTIYEYFSDKGAIVEACAEHASEHFYRQMSKAMERGSSLEEKLGQAAVFVTQARRASPPRSTSTKTRSACC